MMLAHSSRAPRTALVAALSAIALVLGTAAPAAAVVAQQPDSTWMTNGKVNAILVAFDRIYIGGLFTEVRSPDGTTTLARSNLAAINPATGEVDTGWNPGANREVSALATDGTHVFAGGAFSTIGGRSKAKLAALDPVTGAAVLAWRANANSKVRALAVAGGTLAVGGSFTTINDGTATYPRAHLAGVSAATGKVVPGWTADTNDIINALQPSADGSRFFVGGKYTVIGGSAHNFLAAVDAATGAVDATFLANGEYRVWALAVADTRIYAAVGGPGGRIIAFDQTTGVRVWRVFALGDVQALAVSGATLYAGGHFDGAGEFFNADRSRLAAVTDIGTAAVLVDSFAPKIRPASGVWALATAPGRLYVGGDFTTVEGLPHQGFAQFTEPPA